MLNIFDFSDYREYMHFYYKSCKEEFSLYSYRMMGDKIGVDPSQLFRILHKKQHLPPRCVPEVKELLELSGNSAEYFDLIFAASRTKIVKKQRELLDKAYALQEVQRKEIETKELQFLSQWWTAAIRAYLEVNGGRSDPSQISKQLRPPISENNAKDAINLLKELKMVKRLPSERLALAETHLTVKGPDKSKAIREFQRQVMTLAIDSLESVDVEQRDISTLTMAMDEECFTDLKEMAREFRRQVQKRVEKSKNPDRILQLNMAFFPVSQSTGNK